MEIKNSADLKAAIVELENRKVNEKQGLVNDFHAITESLKPLNLLKSTFHKVKESQGIGGNILKAAFGLGVGLLSKKILISKSTGLVKTLLGSAIKMGVAGLVAKNTDNIKTSGTRFFKNMFSTKKHYNGVR